MRRTVLALVIAVVAATALMTPSASAAPGGRPLSTVLSGTNEVPGPGDPDGNGTASIEINQGTQELCYTLTASNIAPATAAHVHVGPPGVAGPVVVPLAAPTDGSVTACRQNVDSELLKDIKKNPAMYYVNVHNADFPAGAIRGQLGK